MSRTRAPPAPLRVRRGSGPRDGDDVPAVVNPEPTSAGQRSRAQPERKTFITDPKRARVPSTFNPVSRHRQRCREVREHMSEYIDGHLDPDTARRVKRHVRWCPNCRRMLENLITDRGRVASARRTLEPCGRSRRGALTSRAGSGGQQPRLGAAASDRRTRNRTAAAPSAPCHSPQTGLLRWGVGSPCRAGAAFRADSSP